MCPPTEQTHVTLTLPSNSTKLGIEQVVTDLMRQAQAAGVYKQAATLLVGACLEQFMEGRGLQGDRRLHIRRTWHGWRIRGELLWVVPQLEDSFLDLLPRLGRSKMECTVLVPPWSSQLARKCSAGICSRGYVQVLGIQQYATLRYAFTNMDLGIGREPVMDRLFWWFNTVAKAGVTDADRIVIRKME